MRLRATRAPGPRRIRRGEPSEPTSTSPSCSTRSTSGRTHEHISRTFSAVLSTSLPGERPTTRGRSCSSAPPAINLFEQCLHRGNRAFTLQQSLLLYAFLLHLIEGTEDFPRRLRMLRNLIAASEDEVRRHNMPA